MVSVGERPQNSSAPRQVLLTADEHLNKEGSECAAVRGLPKFTVPLRMSLLCNPASKVKNSQCKKSSDAVVPMGKKNIKVAAKGVRGVPAEAQATAILLTTTGVHADELGPDSSALEVFGDHFINPLQQDLASNFRNALGLQEDMAAGQGCLDALAVFADQ